jgi:hypothetical protein
MTGSASLEGRRPERTTLDDTLARIYIVSTVIMKAINNMKVEFLRWGNSLALRVPKAFAEEIGAVGL